MTAIEIFPLTPVALTAAWVLMLNRWVRAAAHVLTTLIRGSAWP